jgi:alkylation response protein AidB-like acyl-CoA dehydrogenase
MSTFSLDEDQRQIKESMQRFAIDEIRPIARDCDEEAKIPDDFLEKSWGLGLAANIIPEQYGGYGFNRSVLNNAIMAEELAYGDLSLTLAAMVPNLFVLPVMEMGTDSQKEKYLPSFCGEKYKAGSLAVMEPGITFDAFDIKTKAAKAGDSYVINGEKTLVPMADRADSLLVIASLEKNGPQAFIVDKGTKGLDVARREKNMGLNALTLNSVKLSDCKIPAENRLGGEAGIDYKRLVGCSRVCLSATAVGLASAVKDYCINYAKERVAFGKPIATRQTIAFMLADMAIEVECSRLLNWKAAWSADKNSDLLRMSTLSKTYVSEQAFKISDYGISILGGHGLIREHMVELWFRNARAFAMLEGLAMA